MAYITINKQNFHHNLQQIALKTGAISKIAIVLKDNAYGHGLIPIATLASEFGLSHAVVRTVKEASAIKSLFENILILNDKGIVEEKYSFALNSLRQIANTPKGTRVELKVDTGMHRNGISPHQLDEALAMINQRGLDLIGVMTHYRSADVLSSELFWQQKNFESIKNAVKKAGFETIRFHSHNSATILRQKSFTEDLVRVGIGAYGYDELPSSYDKVGLKPVLSLYASLVASRIVQKGERIGYGGTFITPKEMRVSTYDLGYGDGWSRGESANPYITAEGLPILGRVSMDLLSLESTQERVCIMDDAQKAGKHFGTISYEMTTALSPQIEVFVV